MSWTDRSVGPIQFRACSTQYSALEIQQMNSLKIEPREASGNKSKKSQLSFLFRISMCSEINRGVKRRDFEDVYDEFPHFALLPRKSRRLGCQFTPRDDEESVNCEAERRLLLDQSTTTCTAVPDDDVPIMDVMPLSNPSEDRALVLFRPADLMRSPCSPRLEIKVHPDLVDDLRNYRYQITSAYTPELKDQPPSHTYTTTSLAVIPWINPDDEPSNTTWRPMEADNDSEMIDTEECTESTNSSQGLQQQPQPQHCLLPQASPNKASPNKASPVSWW